MFVPWLFYNGYQTANRVGLLPKYLLHLQNKWMKPLFSSETSKWNKTYIFYEWRYSSGLFVLCIKIFANLLKIYWRNIKTNSFMNRESASSIKFSQIIFKETVNGNLYKLKLKTENGYLTEVFVREHFNPKVNHLLSPHWWLMFFCEMMSQNESFLMKKLTSENFKSTSGIYIFHDFKHTRIHTNRKCIDVCARTWNKTFNLV